MRSFGVFFIVLFVLIAGAATALLLIEGMFGCGDPYGGVPAQCLFLPNP
jgi:hypothetical protein